MKNKKKSHFILFLSVLDTGLLLLLLLSFLPFMNKKKIRAERTALLNPRNRGLVYQIVISNEEDTVILTHAGDTTWTGSSSAGDKSFVWPCHNQKVHNLLDESSEIIPAYKKSSSIKDWKSFSIDDVSSIKLAFYSSDGQLLSKLYFGKEDSLTHRLSVRSGSNNNVYEIESDISSFLTTDESFWADPYIFPDCITEKNKKTSDLALLRGRIENVTFQEGVSADYTVKKSFENGAEIVFSVYECDANFFIVPHLIPGPAFSKLEINALQKINYRYSVSRWTYERLLQSL